MNEKKLFRIGEVAKMFHISMGTLRHYEQEGILTPEYTDERTGYRYYSTRQFEVLNTIRYLRVLDIPLSEIGEFLKNRDVGNYQLTFLVLDEEDCYEGQAEELPETRCVTICFCGNHREAGVYYKKLLDYIDAHRLQITGFSREITLIDYGMTSDSEKFVTEIRIPVA